MNVVVDKLTAQPVLVENGLCTRFRCTKSLCTACIDVCPVDGAVRLIEQGVEVTASCIGCGACASACPNGALQPLKDDGRLADRIRRRTSESGPFRIACVRADVEADLVLSCLARLTEGLILEPIRFGAGRVELMAPDCSSCPLAKAAPQWRRTLRLAGQLCAAAGLGAERVVAGATVRAKPRKALDQPDSRRALFRAAVKWTAEVAAGDDANHEAEQEPPEQFRDQVRRHHENRKRSHLLDVLRALPGARPAANVVPATDIPFARLDVTPKCVGCNVCEVLCPVGALVHREGEGTYTLDVDPAICTGCGVCHEACFFKAIRLRDTVDLSILFGAPRDMLVYAPRQKCQVCNESFLTNRSAADDPSGFCPMCLVSERRREAAARQMILRGMLRV